MKRYTLFLGIVLVLASTQVRAQSFEDHAATLQRLPDIERLYVLKSAENAINAKFKLMFEDPINAEDSYLWAKKVIAGCYVMLWRLATESGSAALAESYRHVADVWSMNIRGELSTDDAAKEHDQLHRARRVLFESELAKVRNAPTRVDFDVLNGLSSEITSAIYGSSVIRASRD
ncbi:hypothetical protein [Neoaquamicrobium sediminum]|uniref:hypothetical protein n=1 Tax=Neoaquamicrobium sediminum TaxID=1849104 RepID=UPI0036218A73